MMNWFYRHRFAFFIGTAAIFLGGMFAGFGSYIFLRSPQDTALKVDGTKISMGQFQGLADQMMAAAGQGKALADSEIVQIKRQAVQELVRREVFWEEAQRHGIHVVDDELRAFIESAPAFRKEGRFDQETYLRTLRYTLHTTPEQFEADQRRELSFRKLQFHISLAVQIPKAELPELAQWCLSNIKDPKEQKKIVSDQKILQQLIHREEINQVMNRWVNQLNTQLRVKLVSPELKNL